MEKTNRKIKPKSLGKPDVSNSIPAELLRQELELRYRQLFETVQEGLLILDAKTGAITDANPYLTSLLGYTRAELVAKKLWQVNAFEALATSEATFLELQAKWPVRFKEMLLKTKDERQIEVEFVGHFQTLGDDEIIQCNIRVIGRHKQAEDALRASEEFYRGLFEHMPHGFAYCKALFNHGQVDDYIYIVVNSAYESLTGLKDVSGKKASEALPGMRETAPKYFEMISRVASSGKPESFEMHVAPLDKWLSVSLHSPRKDYFVGLFNDITEYKRAEESIRQAYDHLEAQFRERAATLAQANLLLQTMMDHIPDHIFFKDLESRFIRNSRSQTAMLGLSDPALIVGKTDFDFFPHAQRAFDEEQEIIRSGRPLVDFEEWVVWPDGRQTWVSTTKMPLNDQNGQVIGTFGIARDITERKRTEEALRKAKEELEIKVAERTAELSAANEHLELELNERKHAEEALRERERKLNTLFEILPVGISILDAERKISYVNPALERILGLSKEDILGDADRNWKYLNNTGAPMSTDESVSAQALRELRTIHNIETGIVKEDGSVTWTNASAVPVDFPDWKVVIVTSDITARKQAEAEVYKLNAELEQRVAERTEQLAIANKELEAFSYSVSHDLRAPLRGIDGWSLALLEDYGNRLDERAQGYLDRVRSETQHMGQLIDDILELSRITRAEMHQEEHVNLSAIAETIVSRLRESEPQRQVEFVTQPGLKAKGDSRLLEVVLVNLLNNAFKFTGRTINARIEFGQAKIENRRVYFVRDNGAGFDMAFAKKLFGVFQRMHNVSEFPGTGVGLATVQRIIHRHGGRIWAEAQVNQGATFYFTLEESL